MAEIYVSEHRKSWYWILKMISRWWIITNLVVHACLFATRFHLLTLCQATFLKWVGCWLFFRWMRLMETRSWFVQSSSQPEDGKNLRLAQQAAQGNAGSAASVPLGVVTDAGDGLSRGILERSVSDGLLGWMWAVHVSEVATCCVSWDAAPDHCSISPSVGWMELQQPKPSTSNSGPWDLPLPPGGRSPCRHFICSAVKISSKSVIVWSLQPAHFTITPVTTSLPESPSSLTAGLIVLIIQY